MRVHAYTRVCGCMYVCRGREGRREALTDVFSCGFLSVCFQDLHLRRAHWPVGGDASSDAGFPRQHPSPSQRRLPDWHVRCTHCTGHFLGKQALDQKVLSQCELYMVQRWKLKSDPLAGATARGSDFSFQHCTSLNSLMQTMPEMQKN